jgi:RIO kinase 1
LYCGGRLVHGDLSEYNILVAPASLLVETDSARVVIEDASDRQDLQAVLIDFGQAVDTRHPDAVILLQHDLDRVKSFFARQGVETMGSVEALAYVVEEDG